MRILEELLKKLIAVFREDNFGNDDEAPVSKPGDSEAPRNSEYIKYEPEVIKKIEILNTTDNPAEKKAAEDWIVNTYNDFVSSYVMYKLFKKDEDLRDHVVYDLFWPRFLWDASPEKKTGIYRYDTEKAKEGGATTPFLRYLQSYIDPIFRGEEFRKHAGVGKKEKTIPKKGDDDKDDFEKCILAKEKPGVFSSDDKDIACKIKKALEKVIQGKTSSTLSPEHAELFMTMHALGRKRPKYIDIAKMFGKAPKKVQAYEAEKEKLDAIEQTLLSKGANKRDLDKYVQFSRSDEDYAKEVLPEIVKSFADLGIDQKDLDAYVNAEKLVRDLAGTVYSNVANIWGDLEKSHVTDKVVALVSNLPGEKGENPPKRKDVIEVILKLKALAKGEEEIEFDPLLERILRLSKSISEWEIF